MSPSKTAGSLLMWIDARRAPQKPIRGMLGQGMDRISRCGRGWGWSVRPSARHPRSVKWRNSAHAGGPLPAEQSWNTTRWFEP